MQLERQMEAGDHLAITLTVNRPSAKSSDEELADSILQMYSNASKRLFIPHFP